MSKVAIASSSRISAEAGAHIANEGGNAVDAAIAASLVSVTTEPGVCSPGAGGFITVWAPGQEPVTIDGAVEWPGRGVPPEQLGQGAEVVYLEYGGGVSTCVRHGSVGTPGAFAAYGVASERYGELPWKLLLEPAWRHARDGFPLPQASHDYLAHSHQLIFGWQRDSFACLHDDDGALLEPGARVFVPYLADSLAAIAEGGAQEFYRGEVGRLIAMDMEGHAGGLTRRDLEEYRAEVRTPLQVELDAWSFATNPPPAIGGITLAAMLQLMQARPVTEWSTAAVEYLVQVQLAVLRNRRDTLDLSTELDEDARRLLDTCRTGDLARLLNAPSTVHTSAVDADGLACSITMSAGYGAGVMPPGTGIWMNNCIGELELNRRGLEGGTPGTRLPSNMAPSVARHRDGGVLAIGSPGASRITSAILQAFVNHVHLGLPVKQAIRHPRAHVELREDDSWRVAYEAGLPVEALDVPSRRFDELSMYFGGVAVAGWRPELGFVVAADPRRAGGKAVA